MENLLSLTTDFCLKTTPAGELACTKDFGELFGASSASGEMLLPDLCPPGRACRGFARRGHEKGFAWRVWREDRGFVWKEHGNTWKQLTMLKFKHLLSTNFHQ